MERRRFLVSPWRGTRSRAHMPLWCEPPPLDTGQSPSAEPQLSLTAAADLGESLHSPAPHFLPLTFIQRCLLILCCTQARLDVPKQTKGKDKNLRMGESICKQSGQQIHLQNIQTAHTALCQKRKQPNRNMSRSKQTFLPRRHSGGQKHIERCLKSLITREKTYRRFPITRF